MHNLITRAMSAIPDRPSNDRVIESCSLLNGLEQELKEQLSAAAYMAYATRGEPIWLAGSPSEFIAIVGTGFVKMTRTTSGGQEIAMELLGPGQCFGLLAAIEGRTFPLSATAVTNCWYLKIPTRAIVPVYQTSVQLKDQVVRSIGPRLRKAHDMMGRFSTGRVEERIAAVLFILADSYGQQTTKGLCIGVPLTRQEIAEMAGTTTETTIRVLSRWQKDGVVTTDEHRITILRENDLMAVLQD